MKIMPILAESKDFNPNKSGNEEDEVLINQNQFRVSIDDKKPILKKPEAETFQDFIK